MVTPIWPGILLESIRKASLGPKILARRLFGGGLARGRMAMAKGYATDRTDEQWAVVEPLLPPAKPGGRPREVKLRLILDTIFYLNKTGCQWGMLPADLA